jgi:hypothetical protein
MDRLPTLSEVGIDSLKLNNIAEGTWEEVGGFRRQKPWDNESASSSLEAKEQ